MFILHTHYYILLSVGLQDSEGGSLGSKQPDSWRNTGTGYNYTMQDILITSIPGQVLSGTERYRPNVSIVKL